VTVMAVEPALGRLAVGDEVLFRVRPDGSVLVVRLGRPSQAQVRPVAATGAGRQS
jgi:hypothetical protein